jgi:predicted DNA-binding ribbon-helix-helix protein
MDAQQQDDGGTDRIKKSSDRHRLTVDISIFHYQRLKSVAGERGITVDELLEELIDRMWTYRAG